MTNRNRNPQIIGICGGSASGKTSICKKIMNELPSNIKTALLSMDCFYIPLDKDQLRKAQTNDHDFDDPNALDIHRFKNVVTIIKNRDNISIKDYDFVTHKLTHEYKHHYDGSQIDILFVEGIHIFQCPKLFDQKYFVEVDDDERLARRILRDTKHRGRTFQESIAEWRKFVKPNYDNIIHTTKKHADIIIPGGAQNIKAIQLISIYQTHLFNHK